MRFTLQMRDFESTKLFTLQVSNCKLNKTKKHCFKGTVTRFQYKKGLRPPQRYIMDAVMGMTFQEIPMQFFWTKKCGG